MCNLDNYRLGLIKKATRMAQAAGGMVRGTDFQRHAGHRPNLLWGNSRPAIQILEMARRGAEAAEGSARRRPRHHSIRREEGGFGPAPSPGLESSASFRHMAADANSARRLDSSLASEAKCSHSSACSRYSSWVMVRSRRLVSGSASNLPSVDARGPLPTMSELKTFTCGQSVRHRTYARVWVGSGPPR
jgi:hypothetical protein